jgi:hypothetical protein
MWYAVSPHAENIWKTSIFIPIAGSGPLKSYVFPFPNPDGKMAFEFSAAPSIEWTTLVQELWPPSTLSAASIMFASNVDDLLLRHDIGAQYDWYNTEYGHGYAFAIITPTATMAGPTGIEMAWLWSGPEAVACLKHCFAFNIVRLFMPGKFLNSHEITHDTLTKPFFTDMQDFNQDIHAENNK